VPTLPFQGREFFIRDFLFSGTAATGRPLIIVALPILARYANGFDANGLALP
jgi:hypothetical protein